jgi:hypothetical protein
MPSGFAEPSDGLEPSTASLVSPVATGGNGFACLEPFSGSPICHRLPTGCDRSAPQALHCFGCAVA